MGRLTVAPRASFISPAYGSTTQPKKIYMPVFSCFGADSQNKVCTWMHGPCSASTGGRPAARRRNKVRQVHCGEALSGIRLVVQTDQIP